MYIAYQGSLLQMKCLHIFTQVLRYPLLFVLPDVSTILLECFLTLDFILCFRAVPSGSQYLSCPDQGGSHGPAVEGRGPNHWNPSFWNSFSSGLVVLSSLSVSLPKMSSFSERIFGDVEF